MTSQTPSEAFKALTDEKDSTNWIVLTVEEKKLVVAATGTGGPEEMKEHLVDNAVRFAAIKIVGVDVRDNVTSRRPKYIQIVFVGAKVGGIKKSAALQMKSEVAKIFNGIAVGIDATDPQDLSMKVLCKELLKCGGAHKPTSYESATESILIADLYT